jgi:hypothetical protein
MKITEDIIELSKIVGGEFLIRKPCYLKYEEFKKMCEYIFESDLNFSGIIKRMRKRRAKIIGAGNIEDLQSIVYEIEENFDSGCLADIGVLGDMEKIVLEKISNRTEKIMIIDLFSREKQKISLCNIEKKIDFLVEKKRYDDVSVSKAPEEKEGFKNKVMKQIIEKNDKDLFDKLKENFNEYENVYLRVELDKVIK